MPWDEHPIDPADPRWELDELDPLGRTAWYQSQPQEVRAAIGLHGIASKMQVGYFFEGVLKRGCSSTPPPLPAGRPGLLRVPRGHRGGAALPDVQEFAAGRPRHGAEAPAAGRRRLESAS